jgi:hypothetical protein
MQRLTPLANHPPIGHVAGGTGGYASALLYLVGSTCLLVALLLYLNRPLLLDRLAGLSVRPSPSSNPASLLPSTVQRFVTASVAGDEETVWQVTSPVYWLELRRRGVDTPQDRADTIPASLSYRPIGGARDERHYGHWLYSTLAVPKGRDRILTIWRVDTDLADRVIWIEPALFLASSCDRVILDLTPRSMSLPSDQGGVGTLVLGARCPENAQGYYILQRTGTPTFTFLSIHENGVVDPSGWTVGRLTDRSQMPTIRGTRLVDQAFKSPAEDAYQSYLRDLN